MIQVPAHVRSLVRIVAVCLVAGLVLAACATTPTATASPKVTGLPAISISVPLSNVACTKDNSCVAIGTSNLDVSPTSVGEYRSSNGRWSSLIVPSADSSTFVQSSSCWNNSCLFVGSRSNRDLVWRYDGVAHSFRVEPGPSGASGIAAISCYSSMTCAILDTAKSGPRFLVTDDAGSTWSTPVSVGISSHDSVTSLSCTSNLSCIASFLNASRGVAVYVTGDGGATWTLRPGHSTLTWSTLTSLNCAGRTCVGLAKLYVGWRVERTGNFGKSWSKVAVLPSATYGFSCTTLERCVTGGLQGSSSPWLAELTSGTLTTVKLTYVPTPIADVACGSKVCAAIGVTTVMTLRP